MDKLFPTNFCRLRKKVDKTYTATIRGLVDQRMLFIALPTLCGGAGPLGDFTSLPAELRRF